MCPQHPSSLASGSTSQRQPTGRSLSVFVLFCAHVFSSFSANSAPLHPSLNMSQATIAPCRTTERSAPTAPTLVGPALPTPAHTQDSTSFTNACLDNYLDLLHQEPRYADLDAGYERPTFLYRPCVDCGQKTGCFFDNCEAQERMPDQRWAKGQLTPLCTTCDAMRGACHLCLGLYCTLAPHCRPQIPQPADSGPAPPPGTA